MYSLGINFEFLLCSSLTVLQIFIVCFQATPFLAGLAVATAALAGRYGIQAWQAFKTRPPKPRVRRFYDGGFQPTMTKREAALILGIRYHDFTLGKTC